MISPKFALPTWCLAAASMLALAGCAQFHQSSREGVSPATRAACRARAEDTYTAQNRGDIYRADSASAATPFSNSGFTGSGNAGLSAQYGYQRALDDCYSTGASPAPETTPTKP